MRLLSVSPILLSVFWAVPSLAMGGFSVPKPPPAKPKPTIAQPAKAPAAAAKPASNSYGFCYFEANGRYATRLFISPIGQGTPAKDAAKREAEAYLLTGEKVVENRMGNSGCVQGPTLESVETELGSLSGNGQYRVVEAGNPNVLNWGYCQYTVQTRVMADRKSYISPVFVVRKSADFTPWQEKVGAAAGRPANNVSCQVGDFYEAASYPASESRRTLVAYSAYQIIDVRAEPWAPAGSVIRTVIDAPAPKAVAKGQLGASGGKRDSLIVRQIDEVPAKPAAKPVAVVATKAKPAVTTAPKKKSTCKVDNKGNKICQAYAR